MIDKNPFNPADSAAAIVPISKDPKPKKKPVNHAAVPSKSKPVEKVEVTAKTDFPAPGDPYWKQHPIITKHTDDTVRPWGEDSTIIKNPNVLPKQMLPPDLSDKAKGYSNAYYSPVNQNKDKSIPEIKSNNFR